MTDLPRLTLKRGHDRRLRAGAPWVFANEVEMTEDLRRLPAGAPVRVALPGGRVFGLAHFNPHALIVARLLTRNTDAALDAAFYQTRLERALAMRERFLPGGFYRLVHGEADGLPGLVVDRYGEVCVVQPNTAGMDDALGMILEAINATLAPRSVVVRADSRARGLEGLAMREPEVRGQLEPPIEVREDDIALLADPVRGQKTGWFFDQRPNRTLIRTLAEGRRVLDLYSYAGGFAVQALAGGATHVTAVDRAAGALDFAELAASRLGGAGRLETMTGDVYDTLGKLTEAKRRFDIIVCDPPPFARAKRELPAARRGYRKLARAAAGVAAPEALLALASCSHHVAPDELIRAGFDGVRDAGRSGRLVVTSGAGPDHPLHPALPETRYLTFLLFALD